MNVLPAVRSQIDQAEEHLQIACKLLRQNGWPETADELVRPLKVLRTWTQPAGWIEAMERENG